MYVEECRCVSLKRRLKRRLSDWLHVSWRNPHPPWLVAVIGETWLEDGNWQEKKKKKIHSDALRIVTIFIVYKERNVM